MEKSWKNIKWLLNLRCLHKQLLDIVPSFLVGGGIPYATTETRVRMQSMSWKSLRLNQATSFITSLLPPIGLCLSPFHPGFLLLLHVQSPLLSLYKSHSAVVPLHRLLRLCSYEWQCPSEDQRTSFFPKLLSKNKRELWLSFHSFHATMPVSLTPLLSSRETYPSLPTFRALHCHQFKHNLSISIMFVTSLETPGELEVFHWRSSSPTPSEVSERHFTCHFLLF